MKVTISGPTKVLDTLGQWVTGPIDVMVEGDPITNVPEDVARAYKRVIKELAKEEDK